MDRALFCCGSMDCRALYPLPTGRRGRSCYRRHGRQSAFWLGQALEQEVSTFVVAHLAFTEEYDDRAPLPSQMVCILAFSAPLVRPMRREKPPFEQARCLAMRFEVRCVDHEALGLGPFTGECREDPVEDAEAAPTDEAVVERLVRSIILMRIFLLQAKLEDSDNAADETAIIDTGNAVYQRKEGLNPSHLALVQQKHVTPHGLLSETVNRILNQVDRS